ncbi:unnamed protein product [Moneuplotes crassus]|uniref:Acyltransferase 3 domain-containing protein n=1 Tax=Euplotes crassus TaxID=5936 RepID=A0AAD1X278_EUPCR|nr:unnamed protein product [Moneuplotes crassus]
MARKINFLIFLLYFSIFGKASGTHQEKRPKEGRLEIVQSGKGTTECVDAIRYSFTPEGTPIQMNMFMQSGRGLNQPGNEESCHNFPHTRYVILTIQNMPSVHMLGFCAPIQCDSEEDFTGFKQWADRQLKDLGFEDAELSVSFPFDDALSPNVGTWATIALFCVIILLCLGGIFAETTSILDKSGADPSNKKEANLNFFGLFLYKFSLINNTDKLFTIDQKMDSGMKVMCGLRALSISWIMLYQVYFFYRIPFINTQTASQNLSNWIDNLAPSGLFGVDIFFLVAGFTHIYQLTTKMYGKRFVNYPLVVLNKYLEFTIPLGFTMLFTLFILPHLGSGARFAEITSFPKCERYWWTTLTYINPVWPWAFEDICLDWTWYLSNEFFFFLFCPFLAFIYCKNRKVGYIVIILAIIGNVILNMVMTKILGLGILMTADSEYDFWTYMFGKPWNNFAPYGIGAIFGLFYFEYKNQDSHEHLTEAVGTKVYGSFHKRRILSTLCFIIGVFISLFWLFIQHSFLQGNLEINPWPPAANMIFNGFSSMAFVLGAMLMILPTFEGRISWYKSFMGSDFMVVGAKLENFTYLLHMPVILFFFADFRHGEWSNFFNAVVATSAIVPTAFLVSIPFTLCCEIPFMNLQKFLLMPKEDAKSDQQVNDALQNRESLYEK